MKPDRHAHRAAIAGIAAFFVLSAALAKSEQGFRLIAEPYVTGSPRFEGPLAAPGDGWSDSAVDGAESGAVAQPVFSTTIKTQQTPWLRVHFAAHQLGDGGYLMLTSALDGQTQRLDAASLPIWQNTSAIFNGDEVQIDLYAGPGDTGVYFTVDHLLVADPEDFAFGFSPEPGTQIETSICGDFDDRSGSNDPRVGRLFFGGCTGWLVHNGAALTAGHCGTPDGNIMGVIEFNVPLSSSNGVPFAAPVNDQYPVTGVMASESGGEGADYAVFSVGPNSNTGLFPHRSQGFFHMTSAVPVEGTTLRVTGYGIDPFPSGTGGAGAPCCDWDDDGACDFSCNSRNLTQQTDTGSCDDCLAGTAIEHTVDTMPANSGSPVIWNSIDVAIAIHAQGGCDTVFSDFDNAGTWLGYGPLSTALQSFLPNRVWLDAASPQTIRTGHVLRAFRNIAETAQSAPSGSTIAIVTGDYPAANGNVATFNRPMTLTAHLGTVRLGN